MRRSARDLGTTWGRRTVTIPGLFVLTALDLALLPILLVVSVVIDVARGGRWVLVRFQAAVAFALVAHAVAVVGLFGAWLAGAARRPRLDARIEMGLARAILAFVVRVYGVRVDVEGQRVLRGGPLVILARHTSLVDPVLPAVFMSDASPLALRWVAKRELLWDPCVEILAHRLRSVFVRRGSRDAVHEIEHVASLGRDLGPHDAIVIFPEGTRFSQTKRAHAIAAAEEAGEALLLARAQRLRHVLVPHEGGPFALLDAAPHADVVFCAHTGLEAAGHLADLVSGAMLGTTLRVRFWRVPASEVPRARSARSEWLQSWWETMDAWLDEARSFGPRTLRHAIEPTRQRREVGGEPV